MRAFVAAVILLALAIIIIVSSSIYISKTADEIIHFLENETDIYIIEGKWKRSRGILSLSTAHDNIFKIDSLIESAHFFNSSGDEQSYRYILKLIKGTLNEIKNFEQLSFSNII